MRVLYLVLYYYCCFCGLLPRLLPPRTYGNPNPDAIMPFSDTFFAETGPQFPGGTYPKTISDNRRLKISSSGALKLANRFCDPKAFIFGSRNGVIRDGLNRIPKWHPDMHHDGFIYALWEATSVAKKRKNSSSNTKHKTRIRCIYLLGKQDAS